MTRTLGVGLHKAFLRRGRAHAFAHRGDRHRYPPGNREGAIASARELGFDHIETDVHLTADGELVLFHDDRLDDETTGTGPIRRRSWRELRSIRYCHDGTEVEEGLVRLADVLERWPDLHWNIDAKDGQAIVPLLELVEAADAAERVLLTSFSLRDVRRIRRVAPSVLSTGLSKPEIALVRLASWLHLPVPRWGDAAQIPVEHRGIRLADRRFVQTCHRAGIAVHVWTVNDPDEMHDLLDLGVDGIITDEPATLKEVLLARDRW